MRRYTATIFSCIIWACCWWQPVAAQAYVPAYTEKNAAPGEALTLAAHLVAAADPGLQAPAGKPGWAINWWYYPAGLLLLVLALIFSVRRRRRRKNGEEEEPEDDE